ncbi:MAG TPA: hypothetical protein VMV51_10705 [Gemmatimonadaceae bacterium]|nr:hypothetical protein [Gemmatimonadaceae bacterium]
MTDVIYVLASVLFFVLMLGYVAACDRLGRAGQADDEGERRP